MPPLTCRIGRLALAIGCNLHEHPLARWLGQSEHCSVNPTAGVFSLVMHRRQVLVFPDLWPMIDQPDITRVAPQRVQITGTCFGSFIRHVMVSVIRKHP